MSSVASDRSHFFLMSADVLNTHRFLSCPLLSFLSKKAKLTG